jgi:hypothetical protein
MRSPTVTQSCIMHWQEGTISPLALIGVPRVISICAQPIPTSPELADGRSDPIILTPTRSCFKFGRLISFSFVLQSPLFKLFFATPVSGIYCYCRRGVLVA